MKSCIRLANGHATDQKRHLVLIRFRIFKMRWASVANDHLGPKPLISDSATRRSLQGCARLMSLESNLTRL